MQETLAIVAVLIIKHCLTQLQASACLFGIFLIFLDTDVLFLWLFSQAEPKEPQGIHQVTKALFSEYGTLFEVFIN